MVDKYDASKSEHKSSVIRLVRKEIKRVQRLKLLGVILTENVSVGPDVDRTEYFF